MKHAGTQTMIITSMEGLCKFMQKKHIEVISMKPIKGIYGDDVMRVEYKYREEQG
jgi:hypothetical protein